LKVGESKELLIEQVSIFRGTPSVKVDLVIRIEGVTQKTIKNQKINNLFKDLMKRRTTN
jgi:hypothetical protein